LRLLGYIKVYSDYYDFAINELRSPEIEYQLNHRMLEQEEIAMNSLVAKLIILGEKAHPDLIKFANQPNIPVKFKDYINHLLPG
jgi:hypothetical protein